MIQNLIIVKDSAPILNESFGKCNRFEIDPILISTFLEAIFKFSKEFKRGTLKQLKFEDSKINYLKRKKMLFIIITDENFRNRIARRKLRKIARVFLRRYKKTLNNSFIDIKQFQDFKGILIRLGIVRNKCDDLNCKICYSETENKILLKKYLINKNTTTEDYGRNLVETK